MSSAVRSLALMRLCSQQTRQYCSAGNASSHFKSLKTKQARFQCDDGLPVFLKGGATDKILYQGTWVLIFGGMGMMCKLFWDLAVPKK